MDHSGNKMKETYLIPGPTHGLGIIPGLESNQTPLGQDTSALPLSSFSSKNNITAQFSYLKKYHLVSLIFTFIHEDMILLITEKQSGHANMPLRQAYLLYIYIEAATDN